MSHARELSAIECFAQTLQTIEYWRGELARCIAYALPAGARESVGKLCDAFIDVDDAIEQMACGPLAEFLEAKILREQMLNDTLPWLEQAAQSVPGVDEIVRSFADPSTCQSRVASLCRDDERLIN